MNLPLQCPTCRAWLLGEIFNQPELRPCPACGLPLQVEVFPALFRKIGAGQNAEAVMIEGESSCFYHPKKKAVVPCEACGRFLCALCDCDLRGQHLCPACLEIGKAKGKIKTLDNERTLYDDIALALAIYPLLFFYFTLVTAPMSLFVAIRYWKAPQGILRRTKTRFVVAMILATLQIAGWTILFVTIARR